ncbi:MAG: DUF433 domain-containing protein [Moorea sp. SIO3I7]|nr:DUF433 domain-containing protein [Moorena sp. SIO3I7]NEO09386.1 DUF433 domain-containing protein [Moorena sp. SIO3I8]
MEISSHQDLVPSADVVFVHGLGGDAITTWHPQGKRDDDHYWLGWLGKDNLCVNIWSFGYQAEATNWKSNSSMPLFDQASNLLDWLDSRELGQRPLIFITHSMGGLLVKKMLNSALTFQKQAILEQTKGIVFLATPHTGAHLANLIDNISVLTQTTVSVKELKAHSPQLRELNEWYRENVRSLGIATKVYYETQPVKGILVVDPDSANPGIEKVKPVAIPKNHIDLCKPESQNSLLYLGVKKFIKECLKTKETAIIIRTEWGLTIAGTRITLYDVMDYVTAQYPPKLIGDVLNLTNEQVSAALSYIEENRTQVEAEYQTILQEEQENRQYWEQRNREHFARIATMPPKPGREALWAKLQEQKARHGQKA